MAPRGGGDWLAPAYCPFYRLLLQMGLSALQTESYHGKKTHRRPTALAHHPSGFLQGPGGTGL